MIQQYFSYFEKFLEIQEGGPNFLGEPIDDLAVVQCITGNQGN